MDWVRQLESKQKMVLSLLAALVIVFMLYLGSLIWFKFGNNGPIRWLYGTRIDATAFPDENFRGYVTAHFDADGNNVLSRREADAVTSIGEVDPVTGVVIDPGLSDLGIYSFKGISNFRNIRVLVCRNNPCGYINLSRCRFVRYVYTDRKVYVNKQYVKEVTVVKYTEEDGNKVDPSKTEAPETTEKTGDGDPAPTPAATGTPAATNAPTKEAKDDGGGKATSVSGDGKIHQATSVQKVGGTIYASGLDGIASGVTSVSWGPFVTDGSGTAYYVKGGSVYRASLSGSGSGESVGTVSGGSASRLFLSGGYLYCGPQRISAKGGKAESFDGEVLCASDKRVYYKKDGSAYCCDSDGSNEQKLPDMKASGDSAVVASNGTVCFISASGSSTSLTRYSSDGKAQGSDKVDGGAWYYDGNAIWVLASDGTVTKFDPSSGSESKGGTVDTDAFSTSTAGTAGPSSSPSPTPRPTAAASVSQPASSGDVSGTDASSTTPGADADEPTPAVDGTPGAGDAGTGSGSGASRSSVSLAGCHLDFCDGSKLVFTDADGTSYSYDLSSRKGTRFN